MKDSFTYEDIIMTIIAQSGEARTYSMEAIKKAKTNEFDIAEEYLKKSNDCFLEAHKVQTQMIQDEINNKKHELTLLMVHAQDHLMNAMTVRELAEEIISLHKRLQKD